MSITNSSGNATQRVPAATPPLQSQSLETVIVPAEPERAAAAVAGVVLRQGGLAALPTETVYGLAAAAENADAVAAVFAAKGRPSRNPLIVHVASAEQAATFAAITPLASRLIEALWPGPLTVVLEHVRSRIVPAARANGPTVAVRCPRSLLMRALCIDAGPLVAPSANRSGRITATSAQAVMAELGGRIGVIVDGGPSPVGIESTVVDCTADAPRLLRPGAISADEIAAAAGVAVTGRAANDTGRQLASPGLLGSHYAPAANVRLDVAPDDAALGEGYLGFGPHERTGPDAMNLSKAGDLAEAASALFSAMRALDDRGVRRIAVAPIPAEGLGVAINDRLMRAAAPRDPNPQDEAPC